VADDTSEALCVAAGRYGDVDMVRMLLADGRAAPSSAALFALAMSRDCAEDVRALLREPNVSASADEYRALRYAAQQGHGDVVGAFFDAERIPARVVTGLFLNAVRSGRVEFVQRMLSGFTACTLCASDMDTAIVAAAEAGLVSTLGVLLKDGRGNPAACGNAAICCATRRGHTDAVRALLADGRADPRATLAVQDGQGAHTSAMCAAVVAAHAGVAEELLADPRVDARIEPALKELVRQTCGIDSEPLPARRRAVREAFARARHAAQCH
jgi:hypothetical protein